MSLGRKGRIVRFGFSGCEEGWRTLRFSKGLEPRVDLGPGPTSG